MSTIRDSFDFVITLQLLLLLFIFFVFLILYRRRRSLAREKRKLLAASLDVQKHKQESDCPKLYPAMYYDKEASTTPVKSFHM